ncbi:unnamed protein product [Lactuca virosa]|uniref:Uncharacterized protein n=1 Tax=Lactuca virosa TaxID=75947 RepID=A0AAU9N0L7_9ASTR|nr:unnamed protein product [Lactuca virosa]
MEQNLKMMFLVMLLLSMSGLFASSVLADKGLNREGCGPFGFCEPICRTHLPYCCNGVCQCSPCTKV